MAERSALALLFGTALTACGGSPASAPDGAVPADGPTEAAPPDTAAPSDAPAADGGALTPPLGEIPLERLWSVSFDAPTGPEAARSIACVAADNDGNVFVAGRVIGKFDADPGPATTMLDAGIGRTYLTKLTADGQHAFTKLFDATVPSDFGVRSLFCATAPDGSVRLGGMFRATSNAPVDFDPGVGVDLRDSGAAGSQHLWVMRVAADGTYDGVRVSTGAANVTLAAMAVATDGALWLSGIFEGDVDLDPSAKSIVLHAGRGIPSPRHTFLARWAADGTALARDPGDFLFRTIAPAAGGDVVLSGNIAAVGIYPGPTALPAFVDADLGLGVDLLSPFFSRSAHVRLHPDASVVWSFGMDAAGVGGTAFAQADGSGVIVGGYTNDHIDFDWSAREDLHGLAPSSTADLFVAGFTADGSATHVSTRAHAIRGTGTAADPRAEISHLAQSPSDGVVYGIGFSAGGLIFPGGYSVGGAYLFAATPNGRFDWALQLDDAVHLGGGGVSLLATSGNGRVVLAGAGITVLRPLACAAGETRACACGYETTPPTVNVCVDGRFAGCGCRSGVPGFFSGDRFAPPPPATCAAGCPTGFQCGEDWLCVPTVPAVRATGLDHPVELVVAGEDVFTVVQGPYVLPGVGNKPAGRVVRLKGGVGPAEVVYTGATPGHLVADGADAWFSDGLSLLKVSPGAAAATVVDSSTTSVFGAIAFDLNWIFTARTTPPPQAWVIERRLRTAPVNGPVALGDTTAGVNGVVSMLSDGHDLYALDDVTLLHVGMASFGAPWVHTGRAQGTRNLAMDGRYVYYVDSAIGNGIYRFEKATGLIDLLVDQILGQLSSPVVEGGALFVAQVGRPSARTWAGDVFRVDLATRAVTQLVPGLNHPTAIGLGAGALWIALHGDTRETTTTGAVHRYAR